jgi:hypothetical protein
MSSVAGTDIEKNEYSKFVIKLVKQITDIIFDNLKYVLRHEIEAAIIERLRKPLDLFRELEKRDFVGHGNLDGLRKLLEMIQEPGLVSMLDNFASSCGISPSKAIAKPTTENHLEIDGYYLKIAGGQHYNRESVGEYVEIPSGSSYALVITNLNWHRCRCEIKIDGHDVLPESIINPIQTVVIERPYQRNGRFKFLALDHAPPGSGINKWKNENGLVEVTFTPERNDMKIICNERNGILKCRVLWCSNETTDVGLRKMIVSVFYFHEATLFSLHFGCKPIGQRNIKLTEYGRLSFANLKL